MEIRDRKRILLYIEEFINYVLDTRANQSYENHTKCIRQLDSCSGTTDCDSYRPSRNPRSDKTSHSACLSQTRLRNLL